MYILLILILVILLMVIYYLITDYYGPEKIRLRPDNSFGLECLRAKDLVVQEFDSSGNLWATRGMIIYKLTKSGNAFIKVAHVPARFSIFWLNNFSLFRRLTLRPECVEMTVADDGSICAFSAGFMWYRPANGGRFTQTMKLERFGRRTGRGIMSAGLVRVNGKEFLFGEYFSNPERTGVKIFRYNNADKAWGKIYEFQPGQIRHIHAIQQDPYTGKLWVCTGDEDSEPMIGWSEDYFTTIHPIGQGSQTWRACQLVFTEEAVFWGADTGSEELAGIYCWDKKSMKLIRLCKTAGAVFYGARLADGAIVMSTDREGFPNEKDDRTRLFYIDKDNKITTIPCGTWKYRKHGFRFNFAKLRFQRYQDNNMLAITVLNQKELPDGELLLVNKDSLASSFSKQPGHNL